MKRSPAVVAYDIRENATRRRVFRVLKDWRIEGQKSVAECFLSRREAEELFVQLCELVDADTDRLAIAWLQQPIRIRTLGGGHLTFPSGLVKGGW
ncbi:MAG: CRISPR-associated endonuclease Cas2 [Hahellaceae bacterium]|nr:CRISPR-associated endonuclease Cas2 [Hahellaceae bacterium]